jgi:hypothetical protein
MEAEIASALAQFGVAGLIGWMWLSERRSAMGRERQVRELHERLMAKRASLKVLVSVIESNTRALTALESSQRGLSALIERLASHV